MAIPDTGSEVRQLPAANDPKVRSVLDRLSSMEGEREAWETLWQDISDYILPRKSSINTVEPQGNNRMYRVHDTTAIRANEKFASGIYGYLTPPDKPWFALEAENADIQAIPEVRDWFATVNRRIRRTLVQSNFPEQIHETYLQLGAFNTACMYLEEGIEKPLIFTDIPCSKYFIQENPEGYVDTVYRKFDLTCKQAVQKFGEENLPYQIVEKYKSKVKTDFNSKFQFVHAVEPRDNYDDKKMDNLNMPVASYWVCIDFNYLIGESGYMEMPYFCVRYSKSNVEVYGRGAGTAHLSDVKQINQMEKTIMKQAEKLVDPPIMMPMDSVSNYRFRTAPNAINYYKATDPRNKPEPFFINSTGNMVYGEEKLEQKRNVIREAWHNDFFQAITNVDHQMTATEVLERVEEKIVLFSPIMARLQTELYQPMLERCFNILYRRQELPPLPEALMIDPRFKISYFGKISQAMKMIENKATLQTLEQVIPMAEIKPEILDLYDFDKIGRAMSLNNGMPVDFLNDEKEIEMIRQQRAQQQMLAQQAELAQMNSQTNKNDAQAQQMLQTA